MSPEKGRDGASFDRVLEALVVLVAVTSCLNSALYTASRMLLSLGNRGDAPAIAKITNNSGTR